MPLLELKILEIHSLLQFSPTCFDIFSWKFTYDFILLYYRSSVSVVNLRQFLWELCLFWNLNYWQYTVFRSFLWHALTYCAEILHTTLFYCTTDEDRVSSISLIFCRRYAPFGTKNTGNTLFSTFLRHALTNWADILHMTLFYCTTDQVHVMSICSDGNEVKDVFGRPGARVGVGSAR